MLKSLTFGNCSFPGLEAENRLPFCSRKSKPSKRGKEEIRGLCAQHLKFDKVCSKHKPEQGVCACVLGVTAVVKEEEARDSLGSCKWERLSPEFANASTSVPACRVTSRDQAVLVAGSSGGRAGR